MGKPKKALTIAVIFISTPPKKRQKEGEETNNIDTKNIENCGTLKGNVEVHLQISVMNS